MFFNQPYASFSPIQKASSILPIKGKLNWGGLLTNTQKTLGVINQAIPIFYQFGPIFKNAKTMFKVMGELNKVNNNDTNPNNIKENKKDNIVNDDNYKNNIPHFFT